MTHLRLSKIRTHLEREFGRPFPVIRMKVNLELPDPTYRLVPKYGGASAEGSIMMSRFAAFGPLDKLETLPGEPYWERSRSMPGRLLESNAHLDCEMAGCLHFYPRELLAFHITEFLRAPHQIVHSCAGGSVTRGRPARSSGSSRFPAIRGRSPRHALQKPP